MLNEFDELILDGSTVFPSYPPLHPGARQRSQYYKVLQTIKLRRGLPVFLNTSNDLGSFNIISNPSNYGTCFIVQYLDESFAYVKLLIDHYKEAAAEGDGDPSLLYEPIQDPETPEENWDVQLNDWYKIPLSESFYIVSCTSNFVAIVADTTNSFNDGSRLRAALASFDPVMVLTSDDFNQPTVPSLASSVPGVPQVAVPDISRSAAQQREDAILGSAPQSTAATKRTTDAALLQPLTVICRRDSNRIDEILGPIRSITQANIFDLIQSLFWEYPQIQSLTALSLKMIIKFLAARFVAHQSGLPNSISSGEFGGITIACFQRNSVDPLNSTNKYYQQAFLSAWKLEAAVGYFEQILNMLAYGETNPEYSVWTAMLSRYRAQLKNEVVGCAAKEPGAKIVTLLVHHCNKALVLFAQALANPLYYDSSDRDWIDYGRSIFRFDDAQMISLATGTAQAPAPQFSNWVPFKKAPTLDSSNSNPVVAAANKKVQFAKRKLSEEDEDEISLPAKVDKKKKVVKTDKKDQICIADFQFSSGLKATPCNNKRGKSGKCERLHIAAPAGGAKWDKIVLDKIVDSVQTFDNGDVKNDILKHILTLR